MSRKIISFVAVAVIFLVFGGLWYHWQRVPEDASSLQSQQSVAVQVASVVSQSVPNHIDTVGTLHAKQMADLSSDTAGKVVKILYTPGSFVKQGTPLIQLDDRTYQSNLQSDEAALELATLNYQRNQSLAKLGAQAKQTLDAARADYLQAQAKVAKDKTVLSETVIKAPFDGFVGAKNVSVGDYVQQGQTLTVLVDRQLLQVDYSFPEKYLSHIKWAQKVTIKLPGHPKPKTHVLMGTVSYIAPQVDPSTHSIALQADIPNTNNALTPGVFVKVEQTTGINEHSLVVPEESLVPTITGNEV